MMPAAPSEWILIGAVGTVGVLHTLVPDHWVPITLIARSEGWSLRQTVRAALIAGGGHTVSTLLIGLLVWAAGVAFAMRFGTLVSTVSSAALIAFGLWICVSSLREVAADNQPRHDHGNHEHEPHRSRRTGLLLILGSSPMVEGLPAFFAAGRYGIGLIAAMAVVFAIATMATYVVLCVGSVSSLQRVSFGPLERYGEVLSGAFIAIVGVVFLFVPVL
jgi:ABC-type nickel/cobalt efflux system permease component RcnA